MYHAGMAAELCEDRPGGRSSARATPRVRSKKVARLKDTFERQFRRCIRQRGLLMFSPRHLPSPLDLQSHYILVPYRHSQSCQTWLESAQLLLPLGHPPPLLRGRKMVGFPFTLAKPLNLFSCVTVRVLGQFRYILYLLV
jgi:hypothetical protein